jgi:carboxyl-terminal processing protease
MDFRLGQLLTAVTAVMMPLLLVAGIWLGGHPEDLPGFMRNTFVEGNDTRVISQAIDRIAHDYYRPVKKSQLSSASIAGAVGSLSDRFSHYLTPKEFREFDRPGSFTGIGVSVDVDPVRLGLLVVQVFDSSPASRAGIKTGDVILAVNGRKLRGLSSQQATGLIKGAPNTEVQLQIQSRGARANVTHTVKVTRTTISAPVVASQGRVVKGVKLGVVALSMFSQGSHGDVHDAVMHELHGGARGILLDLRSNGGGLVDEAQLIASIFIPSGTIVSTRGRTQPPQTLKATGGAISSNIPMVVLVDHNTASASEIVTAALQDHHRATVVGTHTFGKGVFQEEEPLSNGGALDITVGEYFTPSGRNLGGGGVKQGAGITPEVALQTHVVDTSRGLTQALATLAGKVAASAGRPAVHTK